MFLSRTVRRSHAAMQKHQLGRTAPLLGQSTLPVVVWAAELIDGVSGIFM
jgi:hypothetical protein